MDLSEQTSNIVRHPWETARARILLRILREHTPSRKPLRLLDVGCGDYFFLKLVKKEHPEISVDGFDIHMTVDTQNKLAQQELHCTNSISQLKDKYNIILLLDVLEHIKEDSSLLKELAKNHALKGCLFIISVPAQPSLFSSHDTILKHFRRYTPQQLRNVIKCASLIPQKNGSMFFNLFLIRTLSSIVERMIPSKDPSAYSSVGQWRQGPFITKILETMLNIDNTFLWYAHKIGLRVPGLSLWTVAKTK